MATEATANIAAGIVLAAAGKVKEQARFEIGEKRSAWLERSLKKPVRRGWLWWAYNHYRTEAECLAAYSTPGPGFLERSVEDEHRAYPDHQIEWADKFIALARASLETGDGFVTMPAGSVQFLKLSEAAS
jgi:hypothetical protein